MTYEETVSYILDIPRFTKKNKPDHTKELMERLGNPQESFGVIHVAGSNGKGSVCAFLNSVLLESGQTVGLFTSPHLVDIRERIVVNGAICSREDFLYAERIVRGTVHDMQKEGSPHPAFFEYLFAIAMVLFQKAGVKLAVLETGLGGRLDATNVVKRPLLTVITSISLEHTEYLGNTIEEIAAEKAGILKESVPVVYDSGVKEAAGVIRSAAVKKNAPCCPVDPRSINILLNTGKNIDFCLNCGYDITRVRIPFGAAYQARNGALALRALLLLKEKLAISSETIVRGFAHVKWPARMEEILPEVYLDGAHNPDGIRAFLEAVRVISKKPALLLFSMVKEKDYEEAVRLLCESDCFEEMILTTVPQNPRALPADKLAGVFRKINEGHAEIVCIEEPKEAFLQGIADKKPGQHLFCAGSLYLAGELKKITGGFGND